MEEEVSAMSRDLFFRACYTRFIYGAPEKIRTPGLLIRSQTLYPAELRAQDNWYHQLEPIPVFNVRHHLQRVG